MNVNASVSDKSSAVVVQRMIFDMFKWKNSVEWCGNNTLLNDCYNLRKCFIITVTNQHRSASASQSAKC